jgi:hypothetical protein
MMLSPQAARMGTVWTTLRNIGMSKGPCRSFHVSPCNISLVSKTKKGKIVPILSSVRFKSTMANYDSDEDFTSRYTGHKAAANLRATSGNNHALQEPWMINLGRGNDNAWLMGPRKSSWFTGTSPADGCPGVDEHGRIRSMPLPTLSNVTRSAAKAYFDNSWTLYETLFAGLHGEEGFYRPPVHGLRHPQIFYYGHTACLYINKLRVAGVLDKPVNAYFESIFEVGVDEMLWDDMHKNVSYMVVSRVCHYVIYNLTF